MDFSLTPEQQEIQNLARDLTRAEIAPVQLKMDADHEFPYELWRKWSDLGMAGILIPEKYGGSGIDPLTYILALEADLYSGPRRSRHREQYLRPHLAGACAGERDVSQVRQR